MRPLPQQERASEPRHYSHFVPEASCGPSAGLGLAVRRHPKARDQVAVVIVRWLYKPYRV